jgi:hypothetical protein
MQGKVQRKIEFEEQATLSRIVVETLSLSSGKRKEVLAADNPPRNSHDSHPLRYIFYDHCACTDDYIFSDLYTR